jgi:hypothetical protein
MIAGFEIAGGHQAQNPRNKNFRQPGFLHRLHARKARFVHATASQHKHLSAHHPCDLVKWTSGLTTY